MTRLDVARQQSIKMQFLHVWASWVSNRLFYNGIFTSNTRIFQNSRFSGRNSHHNGTQMVGVVKVLRQIIEEFDAEQLLQFCAETGINWIFITPAAPHQNGCAEALVKRTKRALTNCNSWTRFETLGAVHLLARKRLICWTSTQLVEFQMILSYLFPNDLLEELRQKYRKVLSEKPKTASKKWHMDCRNVQPGDTVNVADDNAIRGKWNIWICQSENSNRRIHSTSDQDSRHISAWRRGIELSQYFR